MPIIPSTGGQNIDPLSGLTPTSQGSTAKRGPVIPSTFLSDVPKPEENIVQGIDVSKYEKYVPGGAVFVNEGLEDARALGQSSGEQWGNGLLKFIGKTATATLGGTVGAVVGLPNAFIKDKSVYDNEFQQWLDRMNETMDEKLPNYSTKLEQEEGFLKSLNNANFWANDVLSGLSFTAGAVLSELVWSGVTGGLGSAGILGRAGRYMKNISKGADVAKGLRTTARAKQFGDAGRIMRQMYTGAGYEAGVEARHHKKELEDKLTEEWFANNPGATSMPNSERARIDEVATTSANGVFAANTAIVGLSNMIALPRIFGPGVGSQVNAFSRISKQVDQVADAWKVSFSPAYQSASRLAKIAEASYLTAKNPFVEGVWEEGMQGVANNTMLDYTTKKYNPDGTQSLVELSESFGRGLRDTYGGKQGWKEIGIGMLIGGIGSPNFRAYKKDEKGKIRRRENTPIWTGGVAGEFQERNEQRREADRRSAAMNEANQEKVLEYITANPDVVKSTRSTGEHVIRTAYLNEEMDKAVAEGDVHEAKNVEADMIHSFITSRIEGGYGADVKEEFAEIIEGMSDTEFADTFGYTGMTDAEIGSRKRETLDKFNKRVDDTIEITRLVDSNLQLDLSNERNRDIRESLIYAGSTINNVEAREEQVAEDLYNLTGVTYDFQQRGEKYKEEYKKEIQDSVKDNAAKKKEADRLLKDISKLQRRRERYVEQYNRLFTNKGQEEYRNLINETVEEAKKEFFDNIKESLKGTIDIVDTETGKKYKKHDKEDGTTVISEVDEEGNIVPDTEQVVEMNEEFLMRYIPEDSPTDEKKNLTNEQNDRLINKIKSFTDPDDLADFINNEIKPLNLSNIDTVIREATKAWRKLTEKKLDMREEKPARYVDKIYRNKETGKKVLVRKDNEKEDTYYVKEIKDERNQNNIETVGKEGLNNKYVFEKVWTEHVQRLERIQNLEELIESKQALLDTEKKGGKSYRKRLAELKAEHQALIEKLKRKEGDGRATAKTIGEVQALIDKTEAMINEVQDKIDSSVQAQIKIKQDLIFFYNRLQQETEETATLREAAKALEDEINENEEVIKDWIGVVNELKKLMNKLVDMFGEAEVYKIKGVEKILNEYRTVIEQEINQALSDEKGGKVYLGQMIKNLRENEDTIKKRLAAKKGAINRKINRQQELKEEYEISKGKIERAENQIALFEKASDELFDKLLLIEEEVNSLNDFRQRKRRTVKGVENIPQKKEEKKEEERIEEVHQEKGEPPSVTTETKEEGASLWESAKRKLSNVFKGLTGFHVTKEGTFTSDPNQRRYYRWTSKTDIAKGGYRIKIVKAFEEDRQQIEEAGYVFDDTYVALVTDKDGNYVLENGEVTDKFNRDSNVWTSFPLATLTTESFGDKFYTPETEADWLRDYPGKTMDEAKALFEKEKERLVKEHNALRTRIREQIELGNEVSFNLSGKGTGVVNDPHEVPVSINVQDALGHDDVTISVNTLGVVTIGDSVITSSKLGHTFVKDNKTGNVYEARPRMVNQNEIDMVINMFRAFVKNSTIDEGGMIHSVGASEIKAANGQVIGNMFEVLSDLVFWTGNNLDTDGNTINKNPSTRLHFTREIDGKKVPGGYLQIGNKAYQLFVVEKGELILNEAIANEKGEGALKDFLTNRFMNVSSRALKNKDSYEQFTSVDENGIGESTKHDSYEDYLKTGVVGVSVVPAGTEGQVGYDAEGNPITEEIPQRLSQYAMFEPTNDFGVEETEFEKTEMPLSSYIGFPGIVPGSKIYVEVGKIGEKPTHTATLELTTDDVFEVIEGDMGASTLNNLNKVIAQGDRLKAFKTLNDALKATLNAEIRIADVKEKKVEEKKEEPKPKEPRRTNKRGANLNPYRTPTKDERGLEDVEKAKAWFKERFPDLDFEVVQHLIDGKHHGQLRDAAVYIYNNAEIGTTYHEAFHVVTHLFLTKRERNALYREYRRRVPDHKGYSNAQIEEILAEEFRDYILFRQETSTEKNGIQKTKEQQEAENKRFKAALAEYSDPNTSEERRSELDAELAEMYYAEGEMVSREAKKAKLTFKKYEAPIQMNFFERLFDYIVNFLFGKPDSIMEIFDNIDSNKYRNETPNLRFGKGIKLNRSYEGRDEAFSQAAVEGINYFFFQKLFSSDENINTLFSKESNAALLQELYDYSKDQIERRIGDLQEVVDNSTDQMEIGYLENVIEGLWYVIDNWEGTTRDLHRRFLSQYRLEFVNIEDGIAEINKNNDPDNQWANESIKISSKINASRNIKLLLGTLIDVNDQFETKMNMLELPQNADFGRTFNILANNLAGLRTLDQMKVAIDEVVDKAPWLRALVRRLGMEEDPLSLSREDMLQQVQFVQTFAKTKNIYVFDITGENGKFRVVNANSTSVDEKIKQGWMNNASRKSNLYEEKDGVVFYKKDKFEKMGTIDTGEKAFNMLKEMGITFTIESEVNQIVLIPRVEAIRLQITSEKGQSSLFNKEVNTNTKEDLETLIELERNTTVDYIENSHYNIDNNLVYDVVLNSYMSTIVNDINNYKTLDQLFEENPHLDPSVNRYTVNSLLLKKGGSLYDSKGRLKEGAIMMEIHEGSKEEESDVPSEFEDLGKPDQLRVHVNKGLEGAYPILRPADNSIERYIRLEKPLFSKQDVGRKEHIDQMIDYLKDEMVRSSAILAGENTHWKNFKKNAKDGIVISILSENETIKEAIDAFFSDEKASIKDFFDDEIMMDLIKSTLDDYFTQRTNNFLNTLVEFGIVERQDDGTYWNNGLNLKNNPEVITSSNLSSEMMTYLINDTIFNIEQTKVFFGDPINYKTVSDQFKRHSGMVGTKKISAVYKQVNDWIAENLKRTDRIDRLEKNGKPIIRTVVFDDVRVQSKHYEEYVAKLGEKKASPYAEIEEGDGGGYVSIDEWREMLFRAGEWTFGEGSLEDLYQWEIQTERGVETPTDPVTGREIVKANLPVANPLKPQHMGPLAEDGFVVGFYKLSLFPLLPSVTKGFKQLEALRQKMKSSGTGIAVFQSSNKTGTKLNEDNIVQPLYNEDGDFAYADKDFVTQDTYYKYWGIQQEMGSKVKKRVVSGTQMAKQILNGIFENGKPKNKELGQLAEEYMGLNKERILIGLGQLIDSLGLKEVNGKYTVDNIQEFIDKLKKEAIERELPDNVIDAIDNLNIGNGIDTLINREKVENILFSMADSMTVSQKRFGSAKVQVPNAIGKITRTVINTETGQKWSSSDLEFYHDKDGNIIQMEVYLPAYFRGKVTDNRLKDIIGFRIPTQGLNSIESIRVKGFLPAAAGDSIILPSEIVAKSGSDYDIDKLNVYLPNFYYKDGNPVYIDFKNWESQYVEYAESAMLEALDETAIADVAEEDLDIMSEQEFKKKAIENRISEIQKEIILHPDNYEQLINPVSSEDLANEAKEIRKLQGKPETETPVMRNIAEREYLMDVAERFIGGKQAVGITAIHSTFDILSKMSDVSMAREISVFRNNKVTKVSTNINLPHNQNEQGEISLSKLEDKDGVGNIPERLSQWIGAAVDAAKDPFMFDLNSGPNTLNVVLYLTMAGVPLNYVARFMTQPIILDYLANRQKWESQMMEGNSTVEITMMGNMTIRSKKKYREEIVALTKQPYQHFGVNYKAKDEFTIEELERNIKKGAKGTMDKSFSMSQLQILDDFLRYVDTSRKLGDAIRGVNYDTNAAGKNSSEMVFKIRNSQNVITEASVNNFSHILEEGFISPYYEVIGELRKVMDPLFVTLNDQAVVRQFDKLFEILFHEKNNLPTDKKIRIVDKFKQSFLTYLFVTRPYSVNGQLVAKDGSAIPMTAEMDRLFKGNNSIAHRLLEMKQKYPDMELLSYLDANISDVGNTHHVIARAKNLDTIDSNRLTSEWRELFDQEETFAHDLLMSTILQYGILNTPFTFTNLIPFEVYGEIVNSVLNHESGLSDIQKNGLYDEFFEQFFINNFDDNTIVPRERSPLATIYPYYKRAVKKEEYRSKSKKQLSELRDKGVNIWESKPAVYRTSTDERIVLNDTRKDYRNKSLLLNYKNINPENVTSTDSGTTDQTTYFQVPMSLKALAERWGMMETGFFNKQVSEPLLKQELFRRGYTGVKVVRAKSGSLYLRDAKGMIRPDRLRNEYAQLETQTEEAPDKAIDDKVKAWLSRMGIKYENVEDITDREGNPISAIAKADMLHRVVQVVEGKADITTLPEEAAHFLVELLGDTNPLLIGMMNAVEDHPIYKEVVAQYGELYGYDEFKLKKEAVGKMIAKTIVQKEKVANSSRFQKWFERAWRWIKRHLLNVQSETMEEELAPYMEAADIILGQKVEGLEPLDSLKPNIFYQVTEEEKQQAAEIENNLNENRVQRDLEKGGYITADGKKIINRVTDQVKEFYRKMFRKTETEEKPYNKLLAQKGTIMHKYLEIMGEQVFAGQKPVWREVEARVIADLTNPNDIANEEFLGKDRSFFQLKDANQFGELLNGLTKLKDQIVAKQKKIDPTGKVKFFPELIVYDQYSDVAGTIDLAVLYSNGSVGIYDYKGINFNDTKVLPLYKEDAYEIQISEYKRILQQNYGIKNFAETRIIPIDIQMNKDGRSYREVVMGATGLNDTERPYLEQIPVSREFTDDKDLNLSLRKMFDLYDVLRKRLKNDYKNEKLAGRVARLKEGIRGLQLKGDVSFIFGEINSLYEDFSERENLPPENPYHLSNEFLREMREYINVYRKFGINAMNQAKESGDKGLVHNLERVAHMLDSLEQRVDQKTIENLNKGESFDVTGSAKAEGFIGRLFKQLSKFNRPVFKKLAKIVRQVSNDVRKEVNVVVEDVNEKTEALNKWAKGRGETLQQAYDRLINPKTGNLVSRFSKDYYAARDEAIDKKDKNWFVKNSNVEKGDHGKLQYTGKSLERFTKIRREYFDYIDRTNQGDALRKFRNARKAEWDRKYNITTEASALYNKNNYFIKPEEIESNYSEEYKFMLKPENKPLFDYYTMYVDYNKDFAKRTGKDIRETFVAEIHRDLIDRIGDSGLSGIGELKDSLARALELREFDLVRGSIDPSTGKPVQAIPLFYTDKLIGRLTNSEKKRIENEVAQEHTKGSTEYDAEVARRTKALEFSKGTKSKSRDLSRSLILFADAAYTHQHLTESEAAALSLRDIMKSQGQETELVDAAGKKVINKYTKKVATMLGVPTSELEAFDQFINAYWYGQSTQGADISFGKEGQYSATKLYKSIIKFTSATALGLKPILAAGNLLGIKSNFYMTGWEGRYFTPKNIRETHKMVITRDKRYILAVKFIEPHTHDLTFRKANDNSVSKTVKVFTFENLFILHRKGDEMIDNNVAVSMMQNFGIEDGVVKRLDKIKGEDKRSLLDRGVIENDKFSIEGLTEEQFIRFRAMVQRAAVGIKGNMPQEDRNLVGTTLMGQALMQFRNWMPGLVEKRFKSLHYDELFDDYDVGRFRVFVGEFTAKGVLPKLGAFTKLLGEMAMMNIYNKKGVNMEVTQKFYDKYMLANPESTLTLEEFVELRKAKLRGMAKELQIYLGFLMMVFGGKAMLPEEDEEDPLSIAAHLLAQNSFRVTQRGLLEISFFFDPQSVATILKSPMPSLRFFTDLSKMLKNTVDETRDVVFGEESPYDKTPRMYYFSKIVPVSSSFVDFVDIFETYNKNRGY